MNKLRKPVPEYVGAQRQGTYNYSMNNYIAKENE